VVGKTLNYAELDQLYKPIREMLAQPATHNVLSLISSPRHELFDPPRLSKR